MRPNSPARPPPCTLTVALLLLFFVSHVRAQESGAAPKIEVGAQTSSLTLFPTEEFVRTNTEIGVGGRVTYNVDDHIAVEGEINIFPNRSFFTDAAGGRALQGQFGVKVGKRFGRVGVFVKARPGFVGFTEVSRLVSTRTETTNLNRQATFGIFRNKRQENFSADIGGVIEFYSSRRLVTRFDIGDTIIRYRPFQANSAIFFPTVATRPAETRHNLQIGAGVGFRFH